LRSAAFLKGGIALAEWLPQSVLIRERVAEAYGFRTTVVQKAVG
jgi:hypothetical protein